MAKCKVPRTESGQFVASKTLCIDCRHATATACRWIGRGDLTGLGYVRSESTTGAAVRVTRCDRFEPGALPGLEVI